MPSPLKSLKSFNESISKGEENKFNRSNGVYYTPADVVHYICQQSLIGYLHSNTSDKISKNDVSQFIEEGPKFLENEALIEDKGKETSTYSSKLPSAIKQNAGSLDQLLSEITVCDPAVGSGVFPVGMMGEIVRARQVLASCLSKKTSRPLPYELKRHCIENSLYGVDIDAGAVEIAKLRLWLSLIVDEEDIKQVKPLPNLDYKMLAGDSLSGSVNGIFNAEPLTQLEDAKKRFLNETDPQKKERIQKEIKRLFAKITETAGQPIFDFNLFFSEVMSRQPNPGFDLVVGNPPYGNLIKPEEKKKMKEDPNKHFISTLNEIAFPFVEQGIRLLKQKGTISYIITMGLAYRIDGSRTRQLMQENFSDTRLWSFDRDPNGIFDSMSQSVFYFHLRRKARWYQGHFPDIQMRA